MPWLNIRGKTSRQYTERARHNREDRLVWAMDHLESCKGDTHAVCASYHTAQRHRKLSCMTDSIFWLLSLRTSVHYLAAPTANARSTCCVLVTPDHAWCTREKHTPEGTGCPYTQVMMMR